MIRKYSATDIFPEVSGIEMIELLSLISNVDLQFVISITGF